MHAALYVSKTGLSAQDKQLTTVANNLANASTIGFKRDTAVFEDLLYQVQRQPGAVDRVRTGDQGLILSGAHPTAMAVRVGTR